MTYQVRKGFWRGVKEYFVVQADGDTIAGVVAGPFENEEQAEGAREALLPMYNRRLVVIGGHLVWR